MPTGLPFTGPAGDTGASANFTCNRDKIILLGHKVIGVVEEGQSLSGEQIQDGIDLLGLIVRETDATGRWRWTVGAASHVTIAESVCRYDQNNGLPTNIAELLEAYYRDANGKDFPLNILTAEGYEKIQDKLQAGTPKSVYLTEHITLSERVLFSWPMLTDVETDTLVEGDDTQIYKCIAPHESATLNRPVTGANWPMLWALTDETTADLWVAGTDYTSAPQLRLLFRRPIADFDAASDVPDFPLEWPREIVYRLAFDLGDIYGIPVEERDVMIKKAKGAYNDIFPNTKNKSNARSRHNKVKFY